MKIYKVRYETQYLYDTVNNYKYFINKKNAEDFVKCHDHPYKNSYGMTIHTAKIEEEIKTADEEAE